VTCKNHAYNYNRLNIDMQISYGFGVIVPHVCAIGGRFDRLCDTENVLNVCKLRFLKLKPDSSLRKESTSSSTC
jgi:hypothetical protein